MLPVVAILLWPRWDDTVLTFMPAPISNVAFVCRREWRVICVNPFRTTKWENHLVAVSGFIQLLAERLNIWLTYSKSPRLGDSPFSPSIRIRGIEKELVPHQLCSQAHWLTLPNPYCYFTSIICFRQYKIEQMFLFALKKTSCTAKWFLNYLAVQEASHYFWISE